MKFLLNIDCSNAAFHGDDFESGDCPEAEHICGSQAREIAAILRAVAERIAREWLSGDFTTIHDTNGNDVGRFAIKPDSYQPGAAGVRADSRHTEPLEVQNA